MLSTQSQQMQNLPMSLCYVIHDGIASRLHIKPISLCYLEFHERDTSTMHYNQYPLTSRSRWQCRLMRVLQFFTSPWNEALASSMGTVRWPTPASSVTQMEWMFILRDSPWGTSGMTDWVTFSSSSSRNQSFRSCRLRRSHRSCGTGLSSSSGVSATGLSADWMVITVFMMMGDTLGNRKRVDF